MNWIHDSEFYLERHFDKMVFGEYRAVTERRKVKKYRIHNGNVEIYFRKEWQRVEELNPRWTDELVNICEELAEEKDYQTIHAPKFIVTRDW